MIRLFMGIVCFLIANHFFIGTEIHKALFIALASFFIPKIIDYVYNKLKQGINRGREL